MLDGRHHESGHSAAGWHPLMRVRGVRAEEPHIRKCRNSIVLLLLDVFRLDLLLPGFGQSIYNTVQMTYVSELGTVK